MENASKAALMAGTVAIGVLLLSLFVYMFVIGARTSQAIELAKKQDQLVAENAKFEVYNKNDNTITNMISLANLVYDYNSQRDFTVSNGSIYFEINVGNTKFIIPDTNPGDLKRNGILKNGSVMSIYELTNNKLKDISDASSIAENEKSAGVNDKDKLSTTYFGNDETGAKKTFYKYLFRQEKFTYDLEGQGGLKTMVFRAYINPDWEPTYDE